MSSLLIFGKSNHICAIMEVNMGGRGSTSSLARLQKYGTEFKEVKTTAYGGKLHMRDKRILFIETREKHNKTP